MKYGLIVVFSFLLVFSFLIPSIQAERTREVPGIPEIEPRVAAPAYKRPPDPLRSSEALPDTFVLGEWTFDAPGGGPDPQGWYGVDATDWEEIYFHIDDFAGLSGGYSPLEGNQSLWCGARADTNCSNGSLPGYGNQWKQYFESVPFPCSGDVSLDYRVRYDVEPGYDYVYVQYYHKNGYWKTLKTYTGAGEEMESETIPSDSLDGGAQIRFWFEETGGWNDCDGLFDSDGAVIIDSLTVSDSTGTLDYQDFETESVGDLATSDGDWIARINPPFGDYSGLFDGSTVLQEDTNWTNNTYLWGFFNGSMENYACGGHPEQLVVPHTHSPGSTDWRDYLHNEIWSPWIELEYDMNGWPVPWDKSSLLYEFDVYRDLPLNNLQSYTYRIRSLVDGHPGPWHEWDFFYYGGNKDWIHITADMEFHVHANATHVQLALVTDDWCSHMCIVYGTGECHSHAPLFDNVRLSRVFSGGTAVSDTPPPGNELHQCYPNPFNPLTTISFSLRERAHVTLKIYNAAGQLVRTLLDEPRDVGTHSDVKWDGTDDSGDLVSSGVYFYRLSAGEFSQTKKMVLVK